MLNSNLLNSLLKHCPRDLKNKVVSQRIIERYMSKRKNFEDDN